MHSLCGDLLLQRLGSLQADASVPRNRRLYHCIRDAILDTSLAPHTRLPPSRDLALELGVSRNTVLFAYDQLLAEGYVRARPGSGTFVAATAPPSAANRRDAPPPPAQELAPLSARGSALLAQASASPAQWGAFMPGVPDVTRFPHKRYAQITARLWRQPAPDLLSYGAGGGLLALRQALAEHLRMARAVQCDASQIVVTEGIHQAIDLVVRLLGTPGDTAWVEDPCYWGIRSLLHINGIRMLARPVDGEGITLPHRAAGERQLAPRFIFVTPSHQYPLGSVMSLTRRRALLEHARRHGSWIVEDDYDSEFRFAGQPIASLQGLEPEAPVIYIGTFSKTLYPGLRIGYMVLPTALAPAFRAAHAELYRDGHLMTQAALAEFMRAGDYAAHVRRMRLVYARRRALLRDLIVQRLGPGACNPHDSKAGLHLVLQLPPGTDDVALAHQAAQHGILVRPLSRYYQRAPGGRGLLLGYACVPDEDITPAFERLLACTGLAAA